MLSVTSVVPARNVPEGRGWPLVRRGCGSAIPPWTNTSHCPLVSPGTRSLAAEEKATTRPSALSAGSLPTLTPCVAPVCRSCTNTPVVSPRLVADEAKATKRPSALIVGLKL